MDKFSCVLVDRVQIISLEANLSSLLEYKTQVLQRLQNASVVEGATHTQEDGVEGNYFSLRAMQISLCCTFVACSWLLGLVSSQHLISKVDVTLMFPKIFWSRIFITCCFSPMVAMVQIFGNLCIFAIDPALDSGGRGTKRKLLSRVHVLTYILLSTFH